MKDPLQTTIKENWDLTSSQQQLLLDSIQERKFEKHDLLLQEGQVCQSFFYIMSGAVYQYRLNENMEEEVTGLYTPKDWLVNGKSFTGQDPSETYIKAYVDSRLGELRIEVIHHLINQSNAFFQLGSLLQHADDHLDFLSRYKSPDARYRQILEKKPLILQNFPLQMIASYLRMTPETLSRVRRRMT